MRRYEREQPGELIHIDIKKLGRFDRVGHRITGDRSGQSNCVPRGKGPAGNTSTSASTMPPAGLHRDDAREKKDAVAFLKAALAYDTSSASRSSG